MHVHCLNCFFLLGGDGFGAVMVSMWPTGLRLGPVRVAALGPSGGTQLGTRWGLGAQSGCVAHKSWHTYGRRGFRPIGWHKCGDVRPYRGPALASPVLAEGPLDDPEEGTTRSCRPWGVRTRPLTFMHLHAPPQGPKGEPKAPQILQSGFPTPLLYPTTYNIRGCSFTMQWGNPIF